MKKCIQQVFCVLMLLLVFIAGCGKQLQSDDRGFSACASGRGLYDAIKSRYHQKVSFRSSGRCVLAYEEKGKTEKESFAFRMWLESPEMLRFHGDVAFNARGIDLGSNGQNFWLAMKPKELGEVYYWGLWSELEGAGQLKIDPKIVLEGFGFVNPDTGGRKEAIFSAGKNSVMFYDSKGRKVKRVYGVDQQCRVGMIEYYDDSEIVSLKADLFYEQDFTGFKLPSRLVITSVQGRDDFQLQITLENVKDFDFTQKRRSAIFSRPKIKGFEKVYRVRGGTIVEEKVN